MKSVVVILVAFILLLPAVTDAQQATIGLYTATTGYNCHLGTSDVSLKFAIVMLEKSFKFTLLDFLAPVPPGVTYVGETVFPPYVVSGDSQSGVTVIGPNDCGGYAIGTTVLTILYLAPSSLPPTAWEVKGKPPSEHPVLFDCNDNRGWAFGLSSWINNPGATCFRFQGVAPYLPVPANGSTNSPVNAPLSFKGDANHIWLSTTPFDTPRNEDLVCATAGGGSCPNPFDPGTLAPHTTYYWRAGNVCDPPSDDCLDALSDVWSFTTGDAPVAVRATTWGAIKALYR